ncbi:MAG: 50S ribosomal protein L2 [Lentisphaeraceae bacterium]|nr:50S ribosomal protein L2 [Lentisphaeraceae bacterium]
MGLKSYKPNTPSLRNMVTSDYSEVTRATSEKSLTKGKKSTGGRNNQGRITTRFRGGGVKRNYRQIDFKRNKDGVPAKVAHIEYDPNRTSRIALLHYADGEKRYILAPEGVKQGDTLLNGDTAEFKPGNSMTLARIPQGMTIHAIELVPGQGAVMVRSAGQSATVRGKTDKYAQVKLQSGEVRLINLKCRATLGAVGNSEHSKLRIGKAGKKRYQGKRPHVRGVAMNPVDHPMGGGEGRTSGGSHPVSPWGQLSKGKKTRNPRKSTKMIVEKRKKK